MPRRRDPGELQEAFRVQKSALISSCRAYDGGEKWEALRIATAIYVLLHDGGKRNRCIITQMGLKESLEFAVPILRAAHPSNRVSYTPLVILRLGPNGAGCIPRLNEFPGGRKLIRFGEWWERDVVFRTAGNQHRMMRKKLVFALRNLDGGAHYDEEVQDPNYTEMTRSSGIVVIKPDGTKQSLPELELATMRQMAWEVLDSFERLEI